MKKRKKIPLPADIILDLINDVFWSPSRIRGRSLQYPLCVKSRKGAAVNGAWK